MAWYIKAVRVDSGPPATPDTLESMDIAAV